LPEFFSVSHGSPQVLCRLDYLISTICGKKCGLRRAYSILDKRAELPQERITVAADVSAEHGAPSRIFEDAGDGRAAVESARRRGGQRRSGARVLLGRGEDALKDRITEQVRDPERRGRVAFRDSVSSSHCEDPFAW
jgi:hypothetical protein